MANEYVRKTWKGGATRTTLTTGIAAGTVSLLVADASTYPATGPFVISLDRGTATEEKVLIGSRAGNTLTVTTRGYDGTSAQSHSAGAYVEHVLDAYTIEQANTLATTMSAVGDLLYKSTAGVDNTGYARLAIGAANTVLRSNGTLPSWGQVLTADIASNAVTAPKVALMGDGQSMFGYAGANTVSSGFSSGTNANRPAGANGMLYGNTDSARLDAYSSSWWQVWLKPGTFAARPASATAGSRYFCTDTLQEFLYDGSAWVLTRQPQTTYTPTTSNVTGGTPTGTYTIIDKVLHLAVNMVAGTATGAGSITIGLPAGLSAAASPSLQVAVGQIGATPALASARIAGGGTTVSCFADVAGNNWGAGAALSTYRLFATIQLA